LKIKKVCTYENLQLENLDGTRPRGDMARLSKTFSDREFNISFAPDGIGVILRKKNDGDIMSTFVIPFANIPYLVIDEREGTGSNTAVRGQLKHKTAGETAV
jgi:hypothetical protein